MGRALKKNSKDYFELNKVKCLYKESWQSELLPIEVRLYNRCYSIRMFEEELLKLFESGAISGTTHACIGQEHVGAILAEIITPHDHIVSNHRCHGHYLGVTADYEGLFFEIIGSVKGASRGIGGSQHIYAPNFKSNGILGGTFATAAGYALRFQKIKNCPAISVVIGGDGALGEGIVYETLNIASLLKLPLLIVIENNQWAQSTHISKNMAGSIADRFNAFGIRTFECDHNLILEAYTTISDASDYVRETRLPAAAIINTYRLCHHSKNDDNRPIEEVELAKKNDPLMIFRRLIESNSVDIHEPVIKAYIQKIFSRLASANEYSVKY